MTFKNNIICIIILLLFAPTGEVICQDQIERYSDYSISLSIDPESGWTIAKGKLKYQIQNFSPKDLPVYIDSNMVFDRLLVNGRDYLPFVSVISDFGFMPLARKIVIGEKFLSKGENIIEFSYSGKLGVLDKMFANVVSKEWTEIGLYYPWFPFSPDIKLFTYRVDVTNRIGYDIYGIGNVAVNEGTTSITSLFSTNDIPICLSKSAKLSVFTEGDIKIGIYHKPDNSEFISELSADILQMASKLECLLSRKEFFEITIIESQREEGGGYARIGGIVLGGLDPRDYEKRRVAMKKYIAHELAHLWWYRANTSEWEDWLNESFAEMSCLMAIRDTEGEEIFKSIVEKMRKNSQSTPPLWGFDRSGSDYGIAYNVLYNKGVCFLIDLEERLGRENFSKLFSYLSKAQLTTTNQLIDNLTKLYGEEIGTWFETMIKNS